MRFRFMLGTGEDKKSLDSMNMTGGNGGQGGQMNGGSGGQSGGGSQGGGASNYGGQGGGQGGNSSGGNTSGYGGGQSGAQGSMVNAYGAGGMANGGNLYVPDDMRRRGGSRMDGGMDTLRMYSPHFEGEDYGEDYFPHRMGFTAPLDMEPEARRRRSKRTGRFIRGEDEDEVTMHYGRHHRDEDEEGQERGRYERREREGGEGETEQLKKKIRKLEQRLEEAEEGKEQVEKLHRKLKEMERKLEDKESESEGGKESGKREGGRNSRKKKEKDEDGEDDDEDDPLGKLRHILDEEVTGQEFMKHLPAIFQAVSGVIKNPPPTWPPYIEKGDYSGIFAMESKELSKAIEQYKAGQKDAQAVLKEMKHSGAALIQLYAHLMHQLEEQKQ